MTDITVFCLVHGRLAGQPFSVKTPLSNTVDDLKKLIKSTNTPELDSFAASSLVLWKVNVPAGDKKLQRANANASCKAAVEEILGGEQLDPMQDIQEVVNNPPAKKFIHVIVECPPRKCLFSLFLCASFCPFACWLT
jgi:hypothetical protein